MNEKYVKNEQKESFIYIWECVIGAEGFVEALAPLDAGAVLSKEEWNMLL